MAKTAKKYALFSDLDGTLVTADTKPLNALKELIQLVQGTGWLFVAVTGRRATDVAQTVQKRLLPPFDIIVGTAGTEILHRRPDGTYVDDEKYAEALLGKGFNRHTIVKRCREIIHDLRQTEPRFRLRFQYPNQEAAFTAGRPARFHPFKVSCYCMASNMEDIQTITQLLSTQFPACSIIVGKDVRPNSKDRYCLDILAASKLDALNYLIAEESIAGGVVAGDGGNDVDMLLHTPDSFFAVLVGGHTAQARDVLQAYKSQKDVFIDTSNRRGPQSIMVAMHKLLEEGH